MNERLVTYTFNNVGALSADYIWYLRVPYGLTLMAVSSVGSNAHNATIAIGFAGTPTGYMTAKTVGVSGTPAVHRSSDFVTPAPWNAPNTVLVVTVDFDGASGTAVQNLQVAVTFLVG